MDKQTSNLFKQRPIGYGIAIASILWSILVFFIGYYLKEANFSWWIIFGLIIFWLIIITVLLILDRKNSEINYLQNQINQGTYGLFSFSQELANLKKEEEYLKFFRQFVRYEEYVISIQTYNYYLSSSRGTTEIKIEYENGYVEEKKDINAIIQGNYTFRKRDIVSLRKGIYKYRILSDLSDLEEYFFRKSETNFKNKPDDYALFSLAKTELTNATGVDIGEHSSPLDSEISKMLSKKRLGIAKAILTYEHLKLSTYYSFSYLGKNKSKDNRRYLSYIVESTNGTKRLYLIVYQSEPYSTENDIILLEEQIIKSLKNLFVTNQLVERAKDFDNEQRSDFHDLLQKVKQDF